MVLAEESARVKSNRCCGNTSHFGTRVTRLRMLLQLEESLEILRTGRSFIKNRRKNRRECK